MSKIGELANDLHGDVKQTTNFFPSYRLRAGDWRVLFEATNDVIDVYREVHRSKAYD